MTIYNVRRDNDGFYLGCRKTLSLGLGLPETTGVHYLTAAYAEREASRINERLAQAVRNELRSCGGIACVVDR